MPTKLPHDDLGHLPLHVTYRLLGSLPRNVLQTIAKRRQRKLEKLEAEVLQLPEPRRSEFLNKGRLTVEAQYERAVDEALHTTGTGPYHLAKPVVAGVVLDSWLNLQERSRVFVYAVCVMSNHVHAVIRAPAAETIKMGKLMNNHKGYTARKINEILGRTGLGFWERSYFDRRIRSGKFTRVMWSVLNNPLKAGLAENWREWPYTYLNTAYHDLFIAR